MQDDFSVLYIPYFAKGLIGGLINEQGQVLQGAGTELFAVSKLGTGQYLLDITDQSPDTGILLLTVAKIWSDSGTPEDNILAYQALGDDFLIYSYDLPGLTLQDTQFVFAFISFDNPPTIPEPSTLVLLALGAAGLVGYRWLRCRKTPSG